MTRQIRFSLLLCAAYGLAACGAPQDAAEPAADVNKDEVRTESRTPARPGMKFKVDYQIIGTPVVGSRVAVDLDIKSAYGEEPIDIGYQIPDPSALLMSESQPRTLTATPLTGESLVRERVTVIPQREGRLYINVRAALADDGSTSTMISIPIHVGQVDTALIEPGELQTGDDGETERVIPANE